MDLDKELQRFFNEIVDKRVWKIINRYIKSSGHTIDEAYADRDFIEMIYSSIDNAISNFNEHMDANFSFERWMETI
jgi:hypothetical protein